MSPLLRRSLMGWLVVGLLLSLAASAQVIEEEELAEPDLQNAPGFGEPSSDADLMTLFRAAEGQFLAQDNNAAFGSFSRLLDHFESRRLDGRLNEEMRRLMVLSLTYRARLHWAYADEPALDADLGRIVELAPEHELDPNRVEPELAQRFSNLRESRIGTLRVSVDPPDLTLKIDGREIPMPAPQPLEGEDGAVGDDAETLLMPTADVTLLAGARLLEASRPGFAPFITEVDVPAGQQNELSVVLERTSGVVRLFTRPPGAEVLANGIVRGVTSGQAAPGTVPTGGRYAPEEFSEELILDGFEPGVTVLQIRHPGYRTDSSEVLMRDLTDVKLPPIVLESERGTLILKNFPSGATVRVDGRAARIDNPGSPNPRITLNPGEHRLQVAQGPTQMYSTTVNIADRQTVEVTVRLQPGLAFLGILGGDRTRADDLGRALRLALVESGRWSLLDRREAAAPVLAAAGLDAAAARRASSDVTTVDWAALQKAVDNKVPGLIYLVGVLSDDLLASHADLWVFNAAPGPARPAKVRIELGQQAEAQRFAARLRPSLQLRRAWLGAQVVTSDGAPHPIIANLSAGGPLEAAGAQVGDMLVAIARVPVFTGADVEERLLAAETGEPVDIGLQTAEGTRNLRVTLGTSPLIHPAGIPGVLDPIAYTELQLRAEGAPAEAIWAVGLNQALILMRNGNWDGAVRILRDLKAPQTAGVNQGTIDYYMGLALANVGTRYRDAAITSLRRAAESPDARLLHHDGPYVAPRAKARLLALGAPL